MLVITYHDDELDAHHPLRWLLSDLATSTAMRRLTLEPLSIEAVHTSTQGQAVEPIALQFWHIQHRLAGTFVRPAPLMRPDYWTVILK